MFGEMGGGSLGPVAQQHPSLGPPLGRDMGWGVKF